jgi:hypothetical protein
VVGLAGSIGAEERMNFSSLDCEVGPIENRVSIDLEGEMLHIE